MMQFYFAWCGEIIYPAYSVITTADVWGGSVDTLANIWGGKGTVVGNVTEGNNLVENVQDVEILLVGVQYYITGQGIEANSDGSPLTTFVFDGSNTFALSAPAVSSQSSATFTIYNPDLTQIVHNVQDIENLIVDREYGIEASGLEQGTTFIFNGTRTLMISKPARSTSRLGNIKITSPIDINKVRNIVDISGLISDQVYSIYGPGIPATAFFIHDGSNTATINGELSVSMLAAPISIRKPKTEHDGGPFDAVAHAVKDEKILSFEITQEEGNFASLKIVVLNPGIGLLNPGRKLWCWLSWDTGSEIKELFHGRILGISEDLSAETLTLQFLARPNDYFSQKAALAETLKEPPFYDPLWLQSGLYDPDTVIEAYTVRYAIGRTDLVVSVSDINEAEDGIIELSERDCKYESLKQTYRENPLVNIQLRANVEWDQEAEGDIDFTDEVVKAFVATGSPYVYPIVSSYSGDGLLSTWPAPDASFGGGWSVSSFSSAAAAEWVPEGIYRIKYKAESADSTTSTLADTAADTSAPPKPITFMRTWDNPTIGKKTLFAGYTNWNAEFTLKPLAIDFWAHFSAKRKRTETLYLSLSADTQSISVNPNGTDVKVIELSSTFVAKPVDPEGEMPIGDVRRNMFFPTDRGLLSQQFLLLLMRAELVRTARAVVIKFRAMGWDKVVDISCRQSILLRDRRLPGGQALGKVTAYTLSMAGDAPELVADIAISCSIGYGEALPALPDETNGYVEDYGDGYDEAEKGEKIEVIPGVLRYTSLEGAYVLDDDGIDLFNMTPKSVLNALFVTNGPLEQRSKIAQGAKKGDPVAALTGSPTQVTFDLKPLDGAFVTVYTIVADNLVIPKTYDTEAPSNV